MYDLLPVYLHKVHVPKDCCTQLNFMACYRLTLFRTLSDPQRETLSANKIMFVDIFTLFRKIAKSDY
jgi:hypothetical protein